MMNRSRPYDGQPHTDHGVRGSAEIKGITFRDLYDCYVRAVMLSTGREQDPALYDEATKGEGATLTSQDLYKVDIGKLDANAIAQNLGCEVERIMGIFPNIGLRRSNE